MTKVEAAKLFAVVSGAYPNVQFSADTRLVYESMLADMDVVATNAGVRRLLATSRFMPTIAEIRAATAEVMHGPRQQGGEAWGAVVAAIQRVGSYRPAPDFTDPIVAECVRLMGWKNLCLGENDAADRARFIDLYDQLATRRRTEVVSAPGLVAPPLAPRLPPWKGNVAQLSDETGLFLDTPKMPELPAVAERRAKQLEPAKLNKPMTAAEIDAALTAGVGRAMP